MFILKSKHQRLLHSKSTLIEILTKDLKNTSFDKQSYQNEISSLKLELARAKDLKSILSINTAAIASYLVKTENKESNNNLHVEDILGGIVLRSEANKCIIINKDAEVLIGLTKQKVDKNYSYKLIRE